MVKAYTGDRQGRDDPRNPEGQKPYIKPALFILAVCVALICWAFVIR